MEVSQGPNAELNWNSIPANVEPGLSFPPAWLVPIDNNYVIDRIHWNTEPVPVDKSLFSVTWGEYSGTRLLTHWTYGVELVGLIISLYFGIEGCIVPVAFLPEVDLPSFIFTLASPCHEGKKEFYLHVYDTCLETNELFRLLPAFSSMRDFYRNSDLGKREPVVSVAGGAEATMAAFIQCGFRKPKKEHVGPMFKLDWNSILAKKRALGL